MTSPLDEPVGNTETPNPLVHTITCGSVQLSIFQNESQRDGGAMIYYTIKVSRSYRDIVGRWNSTNSFYKSQLPQLVYACQKALEYLEGLESQPPF